MVQYTHQVEAHYLADAEEAIGDADFWTAAVIHAYPGATTQAWHTDLPRTLRDGRYSVTYFVALTDNCADAPTEYIVGSAETDRYDGLLLKNTDDLPPGAEVRSTASLRRGESICMDTCTMHRGGASRSSHTEVRSIMVVTFVSPGVEKDIDRAISQSLSSSADNSMRRF